MNKSVITEIANRDAFFHLLLNNTGLIILKLGANSARRTTGSP